MILRDFHPSQIATNGPGPIAYYLPTCNNLLEKSAQRAKASDGFAIFMRLKCQAREKFLFNRILLKMVPFKKILVVVKPRRRGRRPSYPRQLRYLRLWGGGGGDFLCKLSAH